LSKTRLKNWRIDLAPTHPRVVLDGTNNTAELRAEIARGNYTHVWASAEAVLADLVYCEKKKPRPVRRPYAKRFDWSRIFSKCRPGWGVSPVSTITSNRWTAPCASTGSFRMAMGQIAKLRDQLEPHTRMFANEPSSRIQFFMKSFALAMRLCMLLIAES